MPAVAMLLRASTIFNTVKREEAGKVTRLRPSPRYLPDQESWAGISSTVDDSDAQIRNYAGRQ